MTFLVPECLGKANIIKEASDGFPPIGWIPEIIEELELNSIKEGMLKFVNENGTQIMQDQ